MRPLPPELIPRSAASWGQIPAHTAYAIARLRQEVFVVEQACVYLDLDGRDLEPGAVQWWAEDGAGNIAAALRVLAEDDAAGPGTHSIGRVVTAPAWRGRGVAAALLDAAIAGCGDGPILLHAQSYLAEWYARFGFVVCGPEELEDGIPHTPMRLR